MHKIKDKVQYRRYLRDAIPDFCDDPVVNEGCESDGTSDEENHFLYASCLFKKKRF